MPRNYELTWQSGANGRQGRWKKKYQGKVYYFNTGKAKSDMDGYRAAHDEWLRKKTEIDSAESRRPKRHQADYVAAIEEWELAQHWARNNGDHSLVANAQVMLTHLANRFSATTPPPLGHFDYLLNQRSFAPQILAEVAEAVELNLARINTGQAMLASVAAGESGLARVPTEEPTARLVEPIPEHVAELDGSPDRIYREVWTDRLATERRKRGASSETVAKSIEAFLTAKRLQVAAGELSAGRCDNLRVYLQAFSNWLGPSVAPTSITGKTLSDYHAELLAAVADGKNSADYSKDRMAAVKTLVRWLWRTEVISQLPRNLDSSDLRITRKVTSPPAFTVDEVKTLLATACARTKLYLLLMLNCGMTQKDVSDLRQEQVDWSVGEITRKRSKTAKHQGVPTVRYRLWPETFRLLKSERSSDPDVVLLNAVGGRLKTESFKQDGKLRKTDNVVSAYRRLATAVKITKPLKLFRKTSASLVASNPRFHGIRDLFLGLAPTSIADRHYAQAPQGLLDEAVGWLAQIYGIE